VPAAKDALDVAPAAEMVDAAAAACAMTRSVGTEGFVRLVDVMPRLVQRGGLGPEAAVVQAARVSYGAGTKTAQSDEVLLRYLYRHEHMTPFEMITLKFCVRAPLFTARQWMRHRAGSFNEESARYSEIETAFFVPDPADVRAQSAANRQGSGDALGADAVGNFLEDTTRSFAEAAAGYARSLGAGVARELARIVLPEGRYTKFYWTVNLRNLFGFLKLRMAPEAQEDIRRFATAIHEILAVYCPLATKAFDDYTLNAVTLSALEVRALREGAPPPEMSKRERAEWEAKRAKLAPGPTQPGPGGPGAPGADG
jgi:thymidylate synthase (FAD)